MFSISHCGLSRQEAGEEENRMKVLIIDDDPAIVENLELTFKVSWPDSVIVIGRPRAGWN